MAEHDPPEVPLDERRRRADLWEGSADEHERLADERERLADEREALADERDRLADRHDRGLDQRQADQRTYDAWTGDLQGDAEAAAAEEALRRAEAAARRAEAGVLRARQASARVTGHAARRAAADARTVAAGSGRTPEDDVEAEWREDRRDFVAAERESLAVERDEVADRRDETADLRDQVADAREREALDRENMLNRRSWAPYAPDEASPDSHDELSLDAARLETQRERRNRDAAGRRAAAHERSESAARMGPQQYGPRLLAAFADLARTLFGAESTADVPRRVVQFAVESCEGCDWAAVTLYRDGRVVETVASHPIAVELDGLQFRAGTGPAPDAMRGFRPVLVPQLPGSPGWPELGAAAARLGVASCLAHGLAVQQTNRWESLGAVTLYSATPSAFDHQDEEVSSVLAAYTAVAVGLGIRREELDRREAALYRGVSTRDVIGQAKGILMERQHLSAGDAFDVLRGASQRLNRKLSDVAQDLADTGELP